MKRNYKRDYEFQKKLNERQVEEIEALKIQIDELISLCEEKDEIIHSVDYLRAELTKDVNEIKKRKKEYEKLIKELKDMKKVMNQVFFNNKWSLIRFLIK